MIIPAIMMRIAAPRTAMAISPGLYLAFFFAGGVCDCPRPCFFFFRGFFDMTLLLYRVPRNQQRSWRVVKQECIQTQRFTRVAGWQIRNSKFEICEGEEPPRGSLDPGGSFKMVGIMVGVNGRTELVGGRNPAGTRWACRRPQKPSGLPRQKTSREKGSITTWQCTHTQYSCLEISTITESHCAQMARLRVTMSRFGNNPVFSPGQEA